MLPSLRRALSLSLAWTLPGLLTAGQYYVLDVYQGTPIDVVPHLVADVVPWQLWAIATPLVVGAGRRWPLTRSAWWRRLPLHLALNLAIAIAYTWLRYYGGRAAGLSPFDAYPVGELVPPMVIKGGVFQILIYWGVITVDRRLADRRRQREEALGRAQLEARLVEAQLDALRTQLRPHFLFNTLNAIAVLMRKGETDGAIRMLGGLSDLLRRSLGTLRVELAPLREELDFIARYVAIELVRFPDRLRVDVDAEPATLDAKVPTLLLQPLVENALVHGVAPRASGGRIELVARVVGDRVRIEIRDDGVGLRADHGEGVGLAHVKKRLAQLYPGRHAFTLGPGSDGGTIAAVELPLDVEAG